MQKSAVRAAFAATFFVAASVLLTSADCKEAGMIPQLRLTQSNGRMVVVALDENKTTLDLLAKLPLTLSFEDYNRTEKVARLLVDRLSTAGAPAGYDPDVGDLCLYTPWGNLCFFYRDFGYSAGLIKLGKVVSGLEHLQELEGQVILERAAHTQGGTTP
jgi:hypothetical protein